jgi:capsular polysaccharide biosynthesis protein
MEQNAQEQEEVDLIEYLNVLWKRRWLIIVPTALLVLITGVVGFLLPPAWEVDAVIQPSKFFVQSAAGTFTEIIVVDPKQLAGQINQRSYERLINAQLHLDPRKFPVLKAENPKDTKLVRVSIKTGDTDKAIEILNALFGHIKSDMDRKIDVEMKSIATQIVTSENNIKSKNLDIQSKEIDIQSKNTDIKNKDIDIRSKNIEIEKTRQAIESAGKKIAISEDRSLSLVAEMKGVKTRVEQIEKQQKTMLTEKREGSDSLGILLYSNEIQQNFRYYNTLEENLSRERISEENLRLFIRDKEQEIKFKEQEIQGIKNQIEKINQEIQGIKKQIEKIGQEIAGIRNDMELLVEKKQRIDYTQLVKEPTVSLYPVFPKKTLNVAIAGFLGLFCFSILALFLNAVEKRKARMGSGL